MTDRAVFQGAVVRRGAVLFVATALGAVLSALLLFVVPPLALLGFIATATMGAMLLAWSNPTEQPAELRVAKEGLFANGTLVARRGNLTAARILPRRQKGPLIEMNQRSRPAIRVAVRSLKQARELVRGLGLDAREGVFRFHVSWLARRTEMGIWFWLFVVFAAAMAAARLFDDPTAMGAVALLAITLVPLLRQTVTIGADGILIETLARKRFLRYDEIRAIHRTTARTWTGQPRPSPGFAIQPKVGRPITIHTLHERQREGMYQNDHLFEVARKLLRKKTSESLPTVLVRGDRSPRQWLAALRLVEAGGYRSLVVDTDDLLRVVADPTAPNEVRAGAIAALSKRADSDAKARLRVIAEDIATPTLRVTIEAALEEDDERLIEALDAL